MTLMPRSTTPGLAPTKVSVTATSCHGKWLQTAVLLGQQTGEGTVAVLGIALDRLGERPANCPQRIKVKASSGTRL